MARAGPALEVSETHAGPQGLQLQGECVEETLRKWGRCTWGLSRCPPSFPAEAGERRSPREAKEEAGFTARLFLQVLLH